MLAAKLICANRPLMMLRDESAAEYMPSVLLTTRSKKTTSPVALIDLPTPM